MWFRLGLVTERPGPPDLPGLPQRMKVETGDTFALPALIARVLAEGNADG